MKYIQLLFHCMLIPLTCIFSINCENVTIPGIGTLVGSTTKTAWTNKTVYQFLGVRYALPPSGEKRFKKPESSVNGREAIHIVREHSRPCPSHNSIPKPNKNENFEDCLSLSIYTKNFSSNFPIMVFIHGGNLENGDVQTYGPNYLLEKDVVYIAIQYRLGALGFLSTKSKEIPGNVGLWDVVEALKWIKRFSSYFGGDSNRITIFGQSAGALLVSSLIVSPSVDENLFQRAIIQSGSYFSPWAYDADPIRNAQALATFSNCSNVSNITEINRCFMNLSVIDLLKAYRDYSVKRMQEHVIYGASKLSEGDILPFEYSPANYLLGNRNRKNISLMVGVNKHDAAFVAAMVTTAVNMTVGLNDTSFNSYRLLKTIGQYLDIPDFTGTVSGLFAKQMFTSDILRKGNYFKMLNGIIDVVNTIVFKAPALVAAQAQAEYYPNSTFLYTFDYRGKNSFGNTMNWSELLDQIAAFNNGTHHTDDLIYLMPFFPLNKFDTKFAHEMISLWTSFAIYGVPKSNGVPMWPPVNQFSGPYLRINQNISFGNDFMDEYSVVSKQ